MKNNQNKNNPQNQHHHSASKPEKSFEAGKHGGQKSPQITNQGTNNPNSLGDSKSRVSNQNKPTQGAGQGSRTETDQSGQKDISNSLKRDAAGNRGANDYTPMNQTDNELGTEKRRNNK
ncbi:hypothetical protein H8S95_08635 [Pontibacter sp. KCTC 32443]|uniref:hypothetical protein n=1 Tax=Pontibacter TaxID=323449 RepID=UPI00164DFCB6|nr:MULTISPECIES: hypothetical protein [Pontibacter]MBC5774126.1 hypothetical protein [Pontibacter sp. KCTC 32443]